MVFALLRFDVITFSSFSFSVVFGYKFINIRLKKIFPVNIKKIHCDIFIAIPRSENQDFMASEFRKGETDSAGLGEGGLQQNFPANETEL